MCNGMLLEGFKMWLKKPESTVESYTKSEIAIQEKLRADQYKYKTTGLLKLYCLPEILVEVNKIDDPIVFWKHLKSIMGHSMSNQHNFKTNFRSPSQIFMKICTKLVYIQTKKNLNFFANTPSRFRNLGV